MQLPLLPGNGDQQVQGDQKENDHHDVYIEPDITCVPFVEQEKLPLIKEHDENLADVGQEGDPHEKQTEAFRDPADEPVQRLVDQYHDQGDGCGAVCPDDDPEKILWLSGGKQGGRFHQMMIR